MNLSVPAMAIADRPSSSFDHIRDSGFETALDQLIAYAEMQARLHQSLGDRDHWLFWIRSWANLQRASDAIAFPVNDNESLAMWREHCGESTTTDIDFRFGS